MDHRETESARCAYVKEWGRYLVPDQRRTDVEQGLPALGWASGLVNRLVLVSVEEMEDKQQQNGHT